MPTASRPGIIYTRDTDTDGEEIQSDGSLKNNKQKKSEGPYVSLSRWRFIVVSAPTPNWSEKFPYLSAELMRYPPGGMPMVPVDSPRVIVLSVPVLPGAMVQLVNTLLLATR